MKAEDIQKLRKTLSMTQEEFAPYVGVCIESVKQWEQKRARPSRLARRRLNDLAAKAPAPGL